MNLLNQKRIIIADDHQLVLTGLEALISSDPALKIVGKSTNGTELIKIAKATDFDMIISDLSMPYMNGLEAIIEIKKYKPRFYSIILTGFDENESIFEKIEEHHINAFIRKTTFNDTLLDCIYKIFNKKQDLFYSKKEQPTTTSYLQIKEDLSNPFHSLTFKDLEFIKYLSMGYKYKQIAELMNVKISTLETHRNKISKKIGDLSTIEIIKMAYKYGLVKTDGIIGLA